jgi:hypothetical protein
VERRAIREVELTLQEGEEGRVTELGPPARGVEVRQGEDEVGHRRVLGAEEGGEAGRLGAGGLEAGVGVHAAMVSRRTQAS